MPGHPAGMIIPRIPHLLYGADYNPEQWPEEVWAEDARLMREAGITAVSLGIFAWARIEPEPGVYDLDWLERVMDLLHAQGIAVNLATATASPPPWLAHLHPETMPVDRGGQPLRPGSRQHYSPASPMFRERAVRLIEAIATRLAGHPALACWHLNNEYSCHVHESFDEASESAFRVWLEARYGTADALNQAWGTAFWSQRYRSFAEVRAPARTPTHINPAQHLDWRRFWSDCVLDLYRAEVAAVRRHSDLPVNTNFMGFFPALDYQRWAREMDFCSWDSYPDPDLGLDAVADNALAHVLCRSFKRRPFILMEQVTSQVNWRGVNVLRAPGEMRAMSLQAIARGGDGAMFFQWRQSRAGAEKFHGALVGHLGPRGRVWEEVCALGADLGRLAEVRGSDHQPAVGLLHSWPARWAAGLDSKPRAVDAVGELHRMARPLWDANIPFDIVHPGDDLSPYRVLVAPLLYLIEDAELANLRAFVARGGTLVLGFFSGIVDGREQIRLGGAPGGLTDLVGARVEEWSPIPDGQSVPVTFADGRTGSASFWADILLAEGCTVQAVFAGGHRPGSPAITRMAHGRGSVRYLAARFDGATLRGELLDACAEQAVGPLLATPPGVEATLRERDGRRWLFLINHTADPQRIDLAAWAGTDLLTGRPAAGAIVLAPRDAAVIRIG